MSILNANKSKLDLIDLLSKPIGRICVKEITGEHAVLSFQSYAFMTPKLSLRLRDVGVREVDLPYFDTEDNNNKTWGGLTYNCGRANVRSPLTDVIIKAQREVKVRWRMEAWKNVHIKADKIYLKNGVDYDEVKKNNVTLEVNQVMLDDVFVIKTGNDIDRFVEELKLDDKELWINTPSVIFTFHKFELRKENGVWDAFDISNKFSKDVWGKDVFSDEIS